MHQVINPISRRGLSVVSHVAVSSTIFRVGSVASKCLNVLIFLAVATTLYAGFQSKFDQRIGSQAYGRFLYALSTAVSELSHGLKGYVYFEPVESALKQGGLNDDDAVLAKYGLHFPENLSHPDLINSAIEHATRLPVVIPPVAQQTPRHNVRGSPGEDLGLVDLVKWSFRLFGERIQSFYLSYCMLFVASVTLFWLAFKDFPERQLVLLSLCVIYSVVFLSPLFSGDPNLTNMPEGWTTVIDPRVLTTLGLIPLVHLIAAAIGPTPGSPIKHALLIAAQAGILSIVMLIRASGFWMLIALSLITPMAILFCILREASAVRGLSSSVEGHKINTSRRWGSILFNLGGRMLAKARPLVLLGMVVLTGQAYVTAKLHPLYGNGYIAHHSLWHDAYYGLQNHPDWNAKFGPAHMKNGVPAGGDDQPIAGLYHYLATHRANPAVTLTDDTGSLNWTAVEYYMYYAFWNMVLENPKFALEAFFVYKTPFSTVGSAVRVFARWVPRTIWFAFAALIVGSALLLAHLETVDWRRYWQLVGAICLCLPISTIPNYVTVMSWETMADTIFLSLSIGVLLATLAVGLLFRVCYALISDGCRND